MSNKPINEDFREGFIAGLDYAVDGGYPKAKRDAAVKLYDQLKGMLTTGKVPAPAPDDPLSRLRARWTAVLERAQAQGIDDPVQELVDLMGKFPNESAPAPDDLRERVAALAQRWTDENMQGDEYDAGPEARAISECAAELRGLLDAAAPKPQPSGPQAPERGG